MFKVVPITADPIGDRDCADGGGGFLSFAFASLPPSAQIPNVVQVLRPDPERLPVGLFPIVGSILSRGCAYGLNSYGKPKMTACDGL
jgi:hypothetical protein